MQNISYYIVFFEGTPSDCIFNSTIKREKGIILEKENLYYFYMLLFINFLIICMLNKVREFILLFYVKMFAAGIASILYFRCHHQIQKNLYQDDPLDSYILHIVLIWLLYLFTGKRFKKQRG